VKTYLCDWSKWQGGPVPAAKIAAEGFGGVWVKASGSAVNGPLDIDPMFLASVREMTKVGGPDLVLGVYHYLVPGFPAAQAALLVDLMELAMIRGKCMVKLDVEAAGLSPHDVERFIEAYQDLTSHNERLWIYTNRNNWRQIFGSDNVYNADLHGCLLEEAHWVSENLRNNPATPYASQQVKGIDPTWGNVNYGGFKTAQMMQFTNSALIAGRRTTASVFPGTKEHLEEFIA
jgi:hypothetical protein